jgi:SAM-dependent methyltransferase
MHPTTELNIGEFDARKIDPYYGVSNENLLTSPLVRDIAAKVSKRQGRVLDVGCGLGTFFSLLHGDVEYDGVDISLPKEAPARSATGRCRLHWADCCEPLPFASAMFDNVVSLWCLEHVARPRVMLAELVRVLKPGGELALVFPNYDNPLRRCPSYWCDLSEDDSIASLRRRFTLSRLFRQLYRRSAYFLKQWLKQVLLDLSRMALFEINTDPAYKHLPWARDRDAIHIVSGRSVVRFLRRQGMSLMQMNNNSWPARILFIGGFFRREPEYGIIFIKRPSSS